MKKSIRKKVQQSSYHSQSIDMDPYSTSIIQQLLNSYEQWKQQDQIVKLTFRALTDIIQVHSQSIKDLKAIITTRASKNQLSTGLTLKSNVSDMSRMVEEVSSAIDAKVSYADINSILRDYAQKKDLRQVLIENIDKEKDTISKSKTDRKEQALQIKIMQSRIDQFQKQISKRLGGCVTLPQFQQLINIVEQKVNISQLNEVLETRVTKQYLMACLQKKVSKTDLQQILSRKVDNKDLDYLIASLQNKVSLSTLQKLTQVIQHKADKSDLVILSNQKVNKHYLQEQSDKWTHLSVAIDSKLNELRKQLQHTKYILNENLKIIQKQNQSVLRNFIKSNDFDNVIEHLKKSSDDQYSVLKKNIQNLQKQSYNQLKYQNFMRELTHQINLRKNCQQKLYQQIDDVRKKTQQIANKSFSKIQFFNFRSQLGQMLQQKIQTQYVQEAFNKWQIQLNAKMSEDKQQIYTLINIMQKTLTDNIAINATDIMNLKSTNSQKNQVIQLNLIQDSVKKIRREMDDCRKTVDLVYEQMQSRIYISQYQNDLHQIRKKFDGISRQLTLKANIKDVCVLADSKPNIDDVNKAFQQLNLTLDLKVSQTDLQNVLKDQTLINQTLCSQNIIGRWLWQSGDTKSGGLVPWQIECANTVPDHFYWQKDKTSILVLSGGIYKLSAGVFSKTATIMILINGQSITNQQSENANNLNMYKKTNKKKKNKQFKGYKLQQFVMIPSRSRISVTVSCEGTQGFLNIHRF